MTFFQFIQGVAYIQVPQYRHVAANTVGFIPSHLPTT